MILIEIKLVSNIESRIKIFRDVSDVPRKKYLRKAITANVLKKINDLFITNIFYHRLMVNTILSANLMIGIILYITDGPKRNPICPVLINDNISK